MKRLGGLGDYDIVILCRPDNFAFMGVVSGIAISAGITWQNNTSTETTAQRLSLQEEHTNTHILRNFHTRIPYYWKIVAFYVPVFRRTIEPSDYSADKTMPTPYGTQLCNNRKITLCLLFIANSTLCSHESAWPGESEYVACTRRVFISDERFTRCGNEW